MVTVIATIRAKLGKEKETELALRGLLEPTHAETGCVKYALHRRKDQPGTFYFVEAWASREHLQTHLTSSHIRTTMARQAEILDTLDIAEVEAIPNESSSKGTLWNF